MIHNKIAKAEWHIPTRILLGEGRVKDIKAQLEYYGFKSPLIICDKLTANSIMIKNILRKLDNSRYSFGIYSHDIDYVGEQQIKFVVDIINKGTFDCIIACGLSQIIAFARFIGTQRHLPVFAVLITAGNTTEFLNYGFVYQNDNKIPKVVLSELDFPKLVIFDTVIASQQNKALLIDSVFAILVHAIEAWCVGGFDPIADTLSFEAIKIIFTQLPQLINNPSHLAPHAYMLSAAIMTGLVETKQQEATSVLAQCLSYIYGIPYGKTAGLLLPHVLIYNLESFGPRLIDLANRLGIKGGAMGLTKALLKLRRMAYVPSKLTDLIGITKMKRREKLMVEKMVSNHPLMHKNANRFTKTAILAILDAAVAGKIKRV